LMSRFSASHAAVQRLGRRCLHPPALSTFDRDVECLVRTSTIGVIP